MTDDELRALVRAAVSRHLGRQGAEPVPVLGPAVRSLPPSSPMGMPEAAWQAHPSHHLYISLVAVTDDCVIEPSVKCDHCGYCKSHGH